MSTLTLYSYQMNPMVGNCSLNAQIMLKHVDEATAQGADVVCFPEMALTGYPPEDLLLRADFRSSVEEALQTLMQHGATLPMILGCPHWQDDECYNAALVIEAGRITHTYHKQALPNYRLFDECRYFSPGKVPCTFSLKGLTIGLLICEDLWETKPINACMEAGAQLIVSLNASPYTRSKKQTRKTLLKQRAIDAGCPIIYLNIVGGQDELIFDGDSQAMDRHGHCFAQAAHCATDCLITRFDCDDAQPLITTPLVPPSTEHAAEQYAALCLALKDYSHKNHFSQVVLGLSGGIDSALTLALCCDALGAEHVHALMMPSRYNASISLDDAQQQVATLGCSSHIISIEPLFKTYLSTFSELFEHATADVTEENIQARIRGNLLMAYSNKTGALVISTGNKSEYAVGYATLYGDMAGGFALLKDVLKTEVYQLARWRNQSQLIIPERIITRPPSAELREHQEDQQTLPDYALLDDIIIRYIEQDQSAEQLIAAGLPATTVSQVIRMIHRNEYKRRQAAPGPRISPRHYGKDRRYPITHGFIDSTVQTEP